MIFQQIKNKELQQTLVVMNQNVPEQSMFGILWFLIFKNGLANQHLSNTKLFSDGTSLFFVLHDT